MALCPMLNIMSHSVIKLEIAWSATHTNQNKSEKHGNMIKLLLQLLQS